MQTQMQQTAEMLQADWQGWLTSLCRGEREWHGYQVAPVDVLGILPVNGDEADMAVVAGMRQMPGQVVTVALCGHCGRPEPPEPPVSAVPEPGMGWLVAGVLLVVLLLALVAGRRKKLGVHR